MKQLVVCSSLTSLAYLNKPDNIRILPMKVVIECNESEQHTDLAHDDLIKLMHSNPKLSTRTLAPNDIDLLDFFYSLIKEDVKEVLVIAPSQHASETLKHIEAVRGTLSSRIIIHLYDSRSILHGEAVLGLAAAKLMEQGVTISDMVPILDKLRQDSHMYLTTDSLRNPVRAGRVSKTSGLMGGLLDIKPLVRLNDDGAIKIFEKIRGIDKSLKRLAELTHAVQRKERTQLYIMANPNNPYISDLKTLLHLKGMTALAVVPIASSAISQMGINAIGTFTYTPH
jgi:DegV family protein with EDD domain